MRVLRVAAAGVTLLLPILVSVPAQADETAPVTTIAGPGSPLDGMFLTYVGCDAMADPVSAPATRINRGPDAAPLGLRSFGLVPAGPGTASGPTISFDSLRDVNAGLDVRAEAGTSGASYIWVSTPDAGSGQVWQGRADLTVAPGAWQHVDTAVMPYDWQLVDLVTGERTQAQSATPDEFVAAHGDGPGMVVTGFGCDGAGFNLDAVRGNDRTWNFEGLSLTTTIAASSTDVSRGDQLSVTGSVTDPSGRVAGDSLVLQSRAPGDTGWRDVSPSTSTGPDGVSQAGVVVTETQEFRWSRPASEYADEGASEPVLVTVTP